MTFGLYERKEKDDFPVESMDYSLDCQLTTFVSILLHKISHRTVPRTVESGLSI